MITENLTNQYLNQLDSLTEAIYMCWHNSYCTNAKQIDEEKLRIQIRSYGFYPFEKKTRKELPLCFRAKLKFKSLTWVSEYTDVIAEDTLCESSELYMLAIKEIKIKVLNQKSREDRIAYANLILRDLDKSYVHNKNIDIATLNSKLKILFGYVLNHNFIAEDNVTTLNDAKVYPIYDLTVRLINHFNFIDKLIELFQCFDISLTFLAQKAKCNLFVFNNCKYDPSFKDDLQNNALPKFKTELSHECLINILHYLSRKKKLVNPNVEIWLFWFNMNTINVHEHLKWNGSPTLLSNVIQHLCGSCISNTIKTAFGTDVFVKPTWKIYQSSKMYKEIERIITVSKQKNNSKYDSNHDPRTASF